MITCSFLVEGGKRRVACSNLEMLLGDLSEEEETAILVGCIVFGKRREPIMYHRARFLDNNPGT